MSSSRDWVEEARLRLEDGRLLLERDRERRALSAAYYALHAAGKGGLLSVGVEINTHTALYKQLSKHFVRSGQLPEETASLIQDLYAKRLAADYDLRSFSAQEVRRMLDRVERLIDHIETLL